MVNTSLKRRRTEDQLRGKVPKKEKKKVKKQKFYHSSSEDEGGARDAPLRDDSSDDEPFQPTGVNALPAEKIEKPVKAAKAAKAQRPAKPEPKLKASIPVKSALKKTTPVAPPKDGKTPAEEADFPSSAGEDDDADDDDDDMELEGDEFDIADSESDASETSTTATRKVRKRNDPDAFATSISKILNTKLTSTKRSEPILSRSKDAQIANRELADSKLSEKARRQIVAERKAAQEKGRVKDVLGLHDPGVSTAATTAKEKDLRRTAQKGVIKLFNAVRAAQVKGEQAEREAKESNVVGMAKREEKVKEMSKQGFLDMITGGQKKEGSAEPLAS